MTRNALEWLAAARHAVSTGNAVEAEAIFEQALSAYPQSAELHGSAASYSLKQGDPEKAIRLYRRAVELAPDIPELKLDLLIALSAGGRQREALRLAQSLEGPLNHLPRYWSACANAAREAGEMAQAAHFYDRCLQQQPTHTRGLHGRARVALARGERDALARFDHALGVSPGEPDLWLGKAQALDAEGRTREAHDLAQLLVDRNPHWIDALNLLAQLRSNLEEYEPYIHFLAAMEKLPGQPSIPSAYIALLNQTGDYAAAAEVAQAAAARFPDQKVFQLAAASNAGMAGQIEEANRLFAALDLETPERWLHEGRHRIRTGELDHAEELLKLAIQEPALEHSAFALLGILWRLTGDARSFWLSGQEGLIARLRLPDAEAMLSDVIPLLHRLHDISSFPVGQSLRGGTQTRHILFQRHEAPIAQLKKRITMALEEYRASLPPKDEAHHLLRHRDDPWAIAGSWSVRLRGGGDHHAAHIHPQGVISSALYLVVPEPMDGSGMLEIGRPPPDLGLDLGPLCTIVPEPGYLALFPSILFHGTTPFEGENRMTVAFDVVPMLGTRHG